MKPPFLLLLSRSGLLALLLLAALSATAQTTWTGATSTDWATASNWYPAAVPTATDDVVIPSSPTNQPTLSSAGAVARSVEVQSGATLTIASSGSLTVNGFKVISPLRSGFFNYGTVENSGQLALGTTSSLGFYGIYNSGNFSNKAGGQLTIDRSTSAGLAHVGGSFTNEGTFAIGANAGVGAWGINSSANITNKSGGRMTIDNSTSIGLKNYQFTFTNEGVITIGANAGVGGTALATNLGSFNNSGCTALLNIVADAVIQDDNKAITNSGTIIENASGTSAISSNSGLVQNLNGGTFTITTNTGILTTTAGAIWKGCTSTDWATATNWSTQTVPTATDNVIIPSGPTNQPTLSSAGAVAKTVEVQSGAKLTIASTGSLTVNGFKSYSGITSGFINRGTVENSGRLALGTTASVGTNGLQNEGAFDNKSGGQIAIDRSSNIGLRHGGGTFTNGGSITIGASQSVGNIGIASAATFNNQPGGQIAIDRSNLAGLANSCSGITCTFTNEGIITLGANAGIGSFGLINQATFQNSGCTALLNIVSDAVISNAGTLTNSGQIVENASGTSSISSNTGIVVNNNGGTFSVGSGPNQPLAVVSTNATQCNPPNASIQLTGLKANQSYTLRYALGNAAPVLLSPDSTSTASGTLTIPGLGAGTYTLTLSGSCVPLPLTLSATLTAPAPTKIQSLTPSQLICANQPFQASVAASGSNLTYRWYRRAGNLFQFIPGATTATASIPAQYLPGTIWVVASGDCGRDSASVTVGYKAPTVLSVTSGVSSVCEGGSLTLSVNGSGPGSLSYAWTKGAGGPVVGSGTSLTLQNAQVSDAGTYVCTLTSECTTAQVSIPVTVRYVRITTQPQSVNLCSGQTTLSVGVQAVGLTSTYQWKRNGTNIVGATSASYVVAANRPGSYTVEVKTACATLTSNAATVGCGNGRLAAELVETPDLVIAPNPVRGGEIRCRVAGLERPEFSLTTATGRSVGLTSKASGEEWVLTPGERLGAGVYLLQASEGTTRLTQRVLVVE
jgi:hypothetical protein